MLIAHCFARREEEQIKRESSGTEIDLHVSGAPRAGTGRSAARNVGPDDRYLSLDLTSPTDRKVREG